MTKREYLTASILTQAAKQSRTRKMIAMVIRTTGQTRTSM